MLPTHYTYVQNIDIELTDEDVQGVCVSGSNDNQVYEVCTQKYVLQQFKEITTKELLEAVQSYDDDPSKLDRDGLIRSLVWMAAWNIFDGNAFLIDAVS